MQDQVKDIDYLNSRFNYDSVNGVLTWKPRSDVPKWWNTKYANTSPSNTDKLGYLRAKMTRGDFSGYVSVHRICFFMYHGWIPEVVDHIDGDVQNNRISNLRPSDWKTNTWNRKANSNTRTGFKGVNAVRDRNKVITGYIAKIGHNGTREYLGYFPTPELASAAYQKREAELREEWSRK